MIPLWPKHSQLLTYHPLPPAHTAQSICHLGLATLCLHTPFPPCRFPHASPSALARPSAVSPAGRRLVPRRRPAISPPTASARTPGARCPGARARRPRRAGGSRRAAGARLRWPATHGAPTQRCVGPPRGARALAQSN